MVTFGILAPCTAPPITPGRVPIVWPTLPAAIGWPGLGRVVESGVVIRLSSTFA